MKENKELQKSLPYIPEEILIQILEKLSLKSLAKAIFVSRPWNSLIHNSINLTKPKILFTSDTYVSCHNQFLVSSMDTQSRVEKVSLPNLISSKVNLSYSSKYTAVHGVVLVELGKFVYLWNPLTKYTEDITLSVRPLRNFGPQLVLGLCHDSLADKYKVVVAECECGVTYIRAYVSVVSPMDTSCVTVDFGHRLSYLVPGPVLNGYLHFHGAKTNLHGFNIPGEIIIAFDPRVDLFSDVAMPDPRAENGDRMLGLGVLDGCLCMARMQSPSNETSNIEILIMKEYGVGNSWTVMCSIRNIYKKSGYIYTLVPLCYNNNGLALVHVNAYRIMTLNISESCLEEVGSISENYQCNAVFYEESWGPSHLPLV